jgi:hypothetical protein
MVKQFKDGWGYIKVSYEGQGYAWFGWKAEVELKYQNWLVTMGNV